MCRHQVCTNFGEIDFYGDPLPPSKIMNVKFARDGKELPDVDACTSNSLQLMPHLKHLRSHLMQH